MPDYAPPVPDLGSKPLPSRYRRRIGFSRCVFCVTTITHTASDVEQFSGICNACWRHR